jgi:hypothetical protein
MSLETHDIPAPDMPEPTPLEPVPATPPTAKRFDPRQHLINLRGKPYLPVAARLLWLNHDCKLEGWAYTIETEFLSLEAESAIARAVVTIYGADGQLVKKASGTKSQTKKQFNDFLEKSETSSVGRALGMLGFGTEFDDEFDETAPANGAARAVDTPQTPKNQRSSMQKNTAVKNTAPRNTRANSISNAPLEPSNTPLEQLDQNPDGLEPYGPVLEENLFSDSKVHRLMTIGGKLFNLNGEVLERRLLEAASKILKKSVCDLHALHWRDGGEVMRQLEEQAVKRGVWESRK